MGLELSTDQKRDIIIAAYGSAGPGADDQTIAAQISRILASFEDGSAAMRAFERAEKRAALTSGVSNFRAVPIYVDLETTSQRFVIFIVTEPSKNAPEGIEIIRTDRIDSAEGQSARAIANQAIALLGHTVLVTKAIEASADGQSKTRLIRGIEDQGLAAGYSTEFNLVAGASMINWQSGGAGAFPKVAPKLERLQSVLAQAQQGQAQSQYAGV